MRYSIQHICEVVQGRWLQQAGEALVEELVYDSRRITYPDASLFFAIITKENNGHRYVEEAYLKGVRNFIVSEDITADLPGANVVWVPDTLEALQALAAWHRSQFSVEVIGITGSNGKTIVKEWLYLLLQDDYNIVRSPKSYNSQLGVPLSVWQMEPQHDLAIFEAGISTTGEMDKLQKVIQPTIGILTNIGEAHDAGFESRRQKAEEKIRLFQQARVVICCREEVEPLFEKGERIFEPATKVVWWSLQFEADFRVLKKEVSRNGTHLQARYIGKDYSLSVHFTDEASLQNLIHCWCLLAWLGVDDATIQARFARLHKIEMRMQLLHVMNDCVLINDSYSADLTSLQIALQFQNQQSAGLTKTVILSDFMEAGKSDEEVYSRIVDLLRHSGVQKLIAIGEHISAYVGAHLEQLGKMAVQVFHDTTAFLAQFKASQFAREIILIKGSRVFHLERVAALFEIKKHQTVLQINLDALLQNVKAYRRFLQPATKIMAMVKAFSYGSGTAEIAGALQFARVDYLAVAYADEGVELVRSGISMPIMVMNTEVSSFEAITEHNLQPVIYSLPLLHRFEQYLDRQGLKNYPVHIEIETGMNRLGFSVDEVDELADHLQQAGRVHVVSVFSHLAASEDPAQDAFTGLQYQLFRTAVGRLERKLPYTFLKHMANSAAIVRHPELQLDMVRLGIGLYGVAGSEEEKPDLLPVATLVTTIAQIKELKEGETVSYNRKGAVRRPSRIATVRLGYADGYSRRFGNGVGSMLVRGQLAPVIGTVCMDMTMLDVTDVPGVQEGDEVVVFGANLPVQQLAAWIGTIPYEILTGISQRVRRVYYHD